LITPAMMAGDRALTMVFDFIDHQLFIQCSDGGSEACSRAADGRGLLLSRDARIASDETSTCASGPCRPKCRIRFPSSRTPSTSPMIPFMRTRIGGRRRDETGAPSNFGAASSASAVPFIFLGSFDLAVTRFSRDGGAPARPTPTRSPAKRTRTKSSVMDSGRAVARLRSRPSMRTRRRSRRD
jgi:hypothetical protein